MDDNTFRKQVNASGFPFQLRVERLIIDTSNEHNWRPSAQEHPWINFESKREGFIDLILEKGINREIVWYMIVECKRTRGDGKWIFLNPYESMEKFDAYVLLAEREQNKKTSPLWLKTQPSPAMISSSFCTVPGQSDKNTPMLERISAELLDSVESLAEAQLNVEPLEPIPGFHVQWNRAVYIPVIVTNTELVVHQFNPTDVDLSEGIIPSEVGEFKTVPFVRFQKSMSTRFTTDKIPMSLREANLESQRTVIIVHAPSFPQLLRHWSFS